VKDPQTLTISPPRLAPPEHWPLPPLIADLLPFDKRWSHALAEHQEQRHVMLESWLSYSSQLVGRCSEVSRDGHQSMSSHAYETTLSFYNKYILRDSLDGIVFPLSTHFPEDRPSASTSPDRGPRRCPARPVRAVLSASLPAKASASANLPLDRGDCSLWVGTSAHG